MHHAAASGLHDLYLVAGLAGLAVAVAVVLLVKPVPARTGGASPRGGVRPQPGDPGLSNGRSGAGGS